MLMKLRNIFNDSRQLARLVLTVGIVLLLVGLAFGAYYYFDRYVHPGDQSPVEMASADLEAAVLENPNDPDLRMALAETYLQGGSYPDAITQANQVLDVYPENQRALFVIGLAYAYQQKYEAAVDPLESFRVIREASPQADLDMALETALYYLGVSYLDVGRAADAIPTLVRAIEINQTDADAMYQLGRAYAQNGQPELALESYQEAVRFVPDFTEAYQGMIESYEVLNWPAYVTYARGMQAFSLKDYDIARTNLEEAVARLPEFASAYIGLGLTYEQLGDLESAQAILQRALELDPGNLTITQALGRIETTTGGE
jgi:tetratricopeptide (TPR) repeat protein